VTQGASLVFNPTLSKRVIDQHSRHGAFRNDLSSLFDDALIDMAIDVSRRPELPPVPGVKYRAFVDPSGGRHDAACIAIAHKDQDLVVVDVLRGVRAPHDPQIVAEDFAKIAKTYGCHEIVGDHYSGAWVEQAFSKAGVSYSISDLTKSEIYLECLAHFSAHKVRLPNDEKLIRELRLLERRVGRSGKDTCDHPRNGSDDFANAACGVIDLCQRAGLVRTEVSTGFGGPAAPYIPGVGNIYYPGEKQLRLRFVEVDGRTGEVLKEEIRTYERDPRFIQGAK
jgi:hypothetical protein